MTLPPGCVRTLAVREEPSKRVACMLRPTAPSAPYVVISRLSPITFSNVFAEMSPSVARKRSIQRSWSSATLVGDCALASPHKNIPSHTRNSRMSFTLSGDGGGRRQRPQWQMPPSRMLFHAEIDALHVGIVGHRLGGPLEDGATDLQDIG